MKKFAEAPFFDLITAGDDISIFSNQLEKISAHDINYFPWPNYRSETCVQFSIAYSLSHVLLKFRVTEKNIRAVHTGINSPVFEDSCVEFFIALDDTGYYNFEFNCIGGKLGEFGKSRKDRQFLPTAAMKKIKTETLIKNSVDNFFLWNLTIMIPFETFIHHHLWDLRNNVCQSNFYKCGDKLPEPHYMSWSPIKTAAPDFHQPQYFGDLLFTGKSAFVK